MLKKTNTQLSYSPHLKEVMAEIKAVLAKHDIAAHILLQEPGFSEYYMAIEPSWSILHFEGKNIGMRAKLAEDFKGDREAQHIASVNTASMIRHFSDILARDAALFEHLHIILNEHWDITHTEGKHTPHRPQ